MCIYCKVEAEINMAWYSEKYTCNLQRTSVAFNMTLAVTRVVCLVTYSVFKGNVQQYQRKIDNFEVLSFSVNNIAIIFVVFCSCGYHFRVHTVHFNFNLHCPPPFPSTHTRAVSSQPTICLGPPSTISHYGSILAIV